MHTSVPGESIMLAYRLSEGGLGEVNAHGGAGMSRQFEDAATTTPPSSIGDPAPLGLAGFGITTLLLSLINAQVIPASTTVLVLSLALPFGGLCQLLAGMWAYRRGNTFAATAFSAYGAFWISFYLFVVVFAPLVPKSAGAGDVSTFLGWYLMAWGIFTAYMFAASLAGARAIQVVFLLLTVTFVLLAIGAWASSQGITQVGGVAGILTAAAAIYASFADVTNANFKRKVLPT
ncbi:MAG: acetate uptake transporter [Candidatus Dormibacteria bacterium]